MGQWPAHWGTPLAQLQLAQKRVALCAPLGRQNKLAVKGLVGLGRQEPARTSIVATQLSQLTSAYRTYPQVSHQNGGPLEDRVARDGRGWLCRGLGFKKW